VDSEFGLPPQALSVTENRSDSGLRWQVHRLRDNPSGLVLVAAGYTIALLLWQWVFPHPLALAIPLVAMTSALSEYFFPIRYRVDETGVHADCGPFQRLHLGWSDVRRIQRGRDGLYVSSLRKPSRLDHFRGIRLQFGGMDPEPIVAAVVAGRDRYRARESDGAQSVV
jgi:hypothetical protein